MRGAIQICLFTCLRQSLRRDIEDRCCGIVTGGSFYIYVRADADSAVKYFQKKLLTNKKESIDIT